MGDMKFQEEDIKGESTERTGKDDGNDVPGGNNTNPISSAQDSKDLSVIENIIPLSPQWLFSKSTDNKPPITPIDLPHTHTISTNDGHVDNVPKELQRADGNREMEKRKEWWRALSLDADGSGRRDRWREEERETSVPRRERWKEGGDGTETRRNDRWTENSLNPKDISEGRRTPLSERRSDAPARETTFETRRDSKWSKRWGPDEKESNRRDKRPETEKEEGHKERQHTVFNNGSSIHNESERETTNSSGRDRDRVWRHHSITARSKGETASLGCTSPKIAPGFGVGRGRGDSTMTIGFSIGRGRAKFSGIPNTMTPSIGASSDLENANGTQRFVYPRGKLLDIYRKSSISTSFTEFPENFRELTELTHADIFEPLAFFTPDMDEEVALEAIMKGDVLSSGACQPSTQEQTPIRIQSDSSWSHTKCRNNGDTVDLCEAPNEQDVFTLHDEANVEHNETIDVHIDQSIRNTEGNKTDNVATSSSQNYREVELPETGENMHIITSTNRNIEFANDVRHQRMRDSEKSEIIDKFISASLCSQPEFEETIGYEDEKDMGESQSSVGDLSFFYIDPQGEIQGPFRATDIIGWFQAGFFGIDLLVRPSNAPEDAAFIQLGDIMPDLNLNMQGRPSQGINLQKGNGRLTESLSTEFSQRLTLESVVHEEIDRNLLQGREVDNREVGTVSLEKKGSVHAEDTQPSEAINVDRSRDATIDKILEWAAATNIETLGHGRPTIQPPMKSSFSHTKGGSLPVFSQILPDKRTPQEVANLLAGLTGEGPQAISEEFPGNSLPHDQSWSDLLMPEAFSHQGNLSGLSAFELHQTQQFKKERLQQQQLELSHSISLPDLLHQRQHQYRQQQHQPLFSEVLRQQQIPEQFLNYGLSDDFNVHTARYLGGSHPSFPLQEHSSAMLEHILRLQQQQQQLEQEQVPSLAYLDYLLRQNQQLSILENLYPSQLVAEQQLRMLQEASRSDLSTQQELLQRHSQELFLQRQQEQARQEISRVGLQAQQLEELLLQRHSQEILLQQQDQARQQHGLLLQQHLSNLDDHCVPGSWKVNEFGEFIQTPVSNPSSALEAFHESLLLNQQRLSSLHHRDDMLGLHEQYPSNIDLHALAELQAQRNLSALLEGTAIMPDNILAQCRGKIGSFDTQNHISIPEQLPYGLQVPKNQYEPSSEGSWNVGYNLDMEMRAMLKRDKDTSNFDRISKPEFNTKSQVHSEMIRKSLGESIDNTSRMSKQSSMQSAFSGQMANISEDVTKLWGDDGNMENGISGSHFHDHLSSWQGAAWTELNMHGTGSQVSQNTPQQGLLDTRADNEISSMKGGPLMGWRNSFLSDVNNSRLDSFQQSRDDIGPVLQRSASYASKREPSWETHIAQHNVNDINGLHSAMNNYLSDAEGGSSISMFLSNSPPTFPDPDVATLREDSKEALYMNTLKERTEMQRRLASEPEWQSHLSEHDMAMLSMSSPHVGGEVSSMWPRSYSESVNHNQSEELLKSGRSMSGHFGDHGEAFMRYMTLKQDLGTEQQFAYPTLARQNIGNNGNESHQAGLVKVPTSSDFPGTFAHQPPHIQNSQDVAGISMLSEQSSLTVADAKAFREWCENQINKLTSKSGAEQLPAPELELPGVSLPPTINTLAVDAGISEFRAKPKEGNEVDEETDLETNGQVAGSRNGKKKTKKVKKMVDPSLLGFNMTSSRILMGDIQHVDDD